MKIKRNIAIGLGVIMTAGTLVAGMSYVSADTKDKNTNTKVEQQASISKQSYITESEAKDIMNNKVPGVEIIEFKLEKDDGILQYDGTLIKDNMEYDIDVNAEMGKIISFEKEIYDEEDKTEDQLSKDQQKQTNNNDTNTSDQKSTEQSADNNKKDNYIGKEKAKQIMKSKVS